MVNRLWTREEILLAINLYCKLPYARLNQNSPEVKILAQLLGRTPSAISMRCCNYAQFDPVESKRVKGLSHAAKYDRAIWFEINADWEKFAAECEQILRRIATDQGTFSRDGSVTLTHDAEYPVGEDKAQMVRVRVGQQFFREAILTAYNHQCCITGLRHDKLLVASHIKPWKDSDPKTERTNPHNGLCLSPLYDKAFDAGLMTIDEHYRVVFSPLLWDFVSREVGQNFFRRYEGQTLLLPERFTPLQLFFEHHRTNIFQNK
ncbi:MAG: HNH endonuclease [bacterium]